MRTTMRELDDMLGWSEQWHAPWTRTEYLAPVAAFALALLIAWI